MFVNFIFFLIFNHYKLNNMKKMKFLSISILMMGLVFPVSAQLGNLKSLGKKIANESGKTVKDSKTDNTNTQQQSEPAEGKKNLGNIMENVTGQEVKKQEEKYSIIFSKTQFDPLQPPAESVINFNAGDPLYAVAYLPKTVVEFYRDPQPNAKLDVEIFI